MEIEATQRPVWFRWWYVALLLLGTAVPYLCQYERHQWPRTFPGVFWQVTAGIACISTTIFVVLWVIRRLRATSAESDTWSSFALFSLLCCVIGWYGFLLTFQDTIIMGDISRIRR